MDSQALLSKALSTGELLGLAILKAIVILIVGLYLARIVKKRIFHVVNKATNNDEILANFISQAASAIILVIAGIAVLSALGVQIASIIALLGTIGVAIALALKNSLSSVAGGIILIVLRPYKKGDTIKIGGTEGVVQAINLFTTILKTDDGKIVTMPNNAAANSTIINSGVNEILSIEEVTYNLKLPYETNLDSIKENLKATLATLKNVVQEKGYKVDITSFEEDYVAASIKIWCDKLELDQTKEALSSALKHILQEEYIKHKG
ncbi:mechanosensitive ion channel domain-containing protein [Helicobacter sp. 11S02629-2]|uniref:mechanosensitive ion channel family protein n=1 Tax=Helicobacter sp. 11S02629-2 TaxID=1476195 RepID=UPI000BA4FFBF|nr:mechanosensitive ion channel domain-containing protein [Helicobacter sp. 11S02629-2]PAF45935.1 hypothetical protein BKH40_00545 [Helicobacter sp. 11S02629-2]